MKTDDGSKYRFMWEREVCELCRADVTRGGNVHILDKKDQYGRLRTKPCKARVKGGLPGWYGPRWKTWYE